MTTITPPYADPGRAAFETMDAYTMGFLLNGAYPPLEPAIGVPLPNSVSYAQFTVVARLNSNGKLVKLVQTDGGATMKAVGVLAQAAALAASGTGNGVVWYSGNFNIDALVWDATFDTDAKKLAAFDGATNPTQIVLGKRA